VTLWGDDCAVWEWDERYLTVRVPSQERPVHCPVSTVNSDSEKICNASRSGVMTGQREFNPISSIHK